MKREFLHRIAAASAALLLAVGFTACSSNEETEVTPTPTKEPSVELNLVRSTANSLTLQVDTQNAEACFLSYVEKGESEPTAEQVLASGVELPSVGTTYTVEELTAQTDYVVIAAVRNGQKSATARLEASTPKAEVAGDVIELNMLIEALYRTDNTAGAGNYEIVIANATSLSWDGDAQMVLDLYNVADEDPINAVLPNGEYAPANDYSAFSYNPSYTYMSIMVDGEVIESPVMGTITVDRTGPNYTITVEGELFLNSMPVKVSYTGPIQFIQSNTATYERFDSDQEIAFTHSQGRYWGSWFYPFADETMLELFQGEIDSEGVLQKGYYLHLSNLYIEKMLDYTAQQIELPNGTYEVVGKNPAYVKTYALPFTFDYGYSTELFGEMLNQGTFVTYVDKSKNVNKIGYVVGGNLTIAGSGNNYQLTFDFLTEEGISITGTYEGALNMGNYNDNDENENWISRPWTTLTEDYTYDWKPETAGLAFLMGDYIKSGMDTWMLMIMASNSEYPNGYGDYFTTELLVEEGAGTTFPTGTFQVNWSLGDHTMLPGHLSYQGAVLFSYYGDLTPDEEGYSMAMAAIEAGTVTISQVGDEYKFVFDLEDGAGNKITGEWQGAVVADDLRDEMAGSGEEEEEDHDHAHALKMQALRAAR